MNAREVMRLMMAVRLHEIYNTLESTAESVGELEDAAAELHIPELFSEGKDE